MVAHNATSRSDAQGGRATPRSRCSRFEGAFGGFKGRPRTPKGCAPRSGNSRGALYFVDVQQLGRAGQNACSVVRRQVLRVQHTALWSAPCRALRKKWPVRLDFRPDPQSVNSLMNCETNNPEHHPIEMSDGARGRPARGRRSRTAEKSTCPPASSRDRARP